jgi:hypothetical protein
MKRKPGTWGYEWATMSLGEINIEIWPSRLGVGYKADDLTVKKNNVLKSKEVKTGCLQI